MPCHGKLSQYCTLALIQHLIFGNIISCIALIVSAVVLAYKVGKNDVFTRMQT